jgi:hypothetical protein
MSDGRRVRDTHSTCHDAHLPVGGGRGHGCGCKQIPGEVTVKEREGEGSKYVSEEICMREDGGSKDECAQGVFDRLMILYDFVGGQMSAWYAVRLIPVGVAVRKREPKGHSQGGRDSPARAGRGM